MYNLDKDLLRKPKLTGWTSGPAIALLFFLFWPVGIYFAYKRARIDKKAAKTIGILVIILGVAFLFNSIRFFSSNDVENIIFCIVVGALFVYIGIHTRKSAKRFLSYLELVIDQGYTTIDQIAGATSSSYDTAKRDLQRLIGDGYLSGSYINDSTGEIVFPGQHSLQYDIKVNDTVTNNEPRAVSCKGCGAINKITAGALGECEFCGSPISI